MFPSEYISSEIIWRHKFLRASPFHMVPNAMDEFLQLIYFLTGCDVRLTKGTCHRHGILVEAQPDS